MILTIITLVVSLVFWQQDKFPETIYDFFEPEAKIIIHLPFVILVFQLI